MTNSKIKETYSKRERFMQHVSTDLEDMLKEARTHELHEVYIHLTRAKDNIDLELAMTHAEKNGRVNNARVISDILNR